MSLRFLCLGLAACLSFAALTAQTQVPAAAPAPAPAAPGDDELVGPIKLPAADIDTVLGLLEIYTGRAILRPQTLPTATTYPLVIDRKLPKSEAILALETILSLNQVGVAPLGEHFLKVVPLGQTKSEAPEMITGSTLDRLPSGQIATKLFQLQFLRVNEFAPQITPLMTAGIPNGVVALDKANAVLVTDTVSNLQRVEVLLGQLDRPTTVGLTPKFYVLRNGAKASDVVNKLRAMFQGPLQSQLGTATSFSADDRSNQIILLADSRQVPLFDDLIAKLDVKADPNTRNEVIYLKHASAKDVAPLLSQLVSGQNTAAQKGNGGASTRPGQILTPNTTTPAGPSGAPVTAAAMPAGALVDNTNEFSTLLTILPDERSNSLVVSGTVDDIRLIRELVDKVDVILAQVRIEVVIAEVTLSDTDKSGISALNLTVGTTTDGRGTHITNFDTATLAGWGVTAGVVNPLSFKAALGDTGSKSNVKILSTPVIVTMHNKEAEILVGQSQPLITGTQSTPIATGTTTGSGFATSSQVTYKDIAIDLKVTPLIGDDGNIQLKIDQKVDDILGNVTIDNNQQPIIGRRQATSFLNVADGQMIVLGGLQRSKTTLDRTKLGLLYEIPIISQLLGGHTNTVERTELLLFIRPHVIRPDEGTGDTNKAIDQLSNRDEINQYLVNPSEKPKKKLIDRIR